MIRCNYKLGYLKLGLIEDCVGKVTHIVFVTLVRDYPSHMYFFSDYACWVIFFVVFVLKAMRASAVHEVQLQGSIAAPQGSTMVPHSHIN